MGNKVFGIGVVSSLRLYNWPLPLFYGMPCSHPGENIAQTTLYNGTTNSRESGDERSIRLKYSTVPAPSKRSSWANLYFGSTWKVHRCRSRVQVLCAHSVRPDTRPPFVSFFVSVCRVAPQWCCSVDDLARLRLKWLTMLVRTIIASRDILMRRNFSGGPSWGWG